MRVAAGRCGVWGCAVRVDRGTLWLPLRRRCPIDGSLATNVVGLLGLIWLVAAAVPALRRALPFAWEHPLGVFGTVTLLVGNALGLYYAPAERFMGDVGRILYVHVPAAWIAMICFSLAFLFALGFLFSGKRGWDSAMEAACEVGVMQGMLLLLLGAIFARPTWGVWWSWDPRLTSSAVMMLSFVGVLLLRGVVNDPDRRATWSGIATILAGVNVPVTYMSVKWWRSIHQVQSETTKGSTIDESMRWILYFNTWAFLFLTVWFLAQRYRLAERRAEAETPEPLPEVAV
jgi:heme exporter protein C